MQQPILNTHHTLKRGRIGRSLALLLLTAATLRVAGAQQTVDSAQWLQFIGLELRQLRIELLEQRIAAESDRLLGIEREERALRLEQSKTRNLEQSQTAQLTELQKQVSDPGGDAQSHAHIQAIIGELASTADATRIANNAVTAREADTQEKLRAVKTRIQAVTSRLKQLSAAER